VCEDATSKLGRVIVVRARENGPREFSFNRERAPEPDPEPPVPWRSRGIPKRAHRKGGLGQPCGGLGAALLATDDLEQREWRHVARYPLAADRPRTDIPDMSLLTRLDSVINNGVLSRIFTSDTEVDGPVHVRWNPETPLGQIGQLLDDAGDLEFYASETEDSGFPEDRRRSVKDRKNAVKLRAKAKALADALKEEERVMALYIGDPEFIAFVNYGTRPE
jgi:hypothetical protein